MENPNNRIVAVGRLSGELELSHEVMNEPFYTGTLMVKRLSGAVDRLPVTIPGKLMALLPEEDGRSFEVDRLLDVRWASARDAGGQGMRYTCRVRGRQVYLFEDEGRWFVEARGAPSG